jgi:hypothetical protein
MTTQESRFGVLVELIRTRPCAAIGFVDYPIIEIEMERDPAAVFPSRYAIFGLRLDGRRVRYELTPMIKPEKGDSREDDWRSRREHHEFRRRVRAWRDWLRPRLKKLGLRMGRRVASVHEMEGAC